MTYYYGNPVGAEVYCVWERQHGVVLKYDPFTGGMNDVVVRFEDGRKVWTSCHMLKRTDGAALPDHREVCKARDEQTLAQLQSIRAQHVRDFNKPWPGAEHGKAIVGMALDGAIKDVKRRLNK